MVVSHCETKECVDNLDEILKIDGIDVIFIGPMDLSQSLGVPGQTGSELVKSTIDTIFEKVGKSDKAIGTTAGTPEAALALIERGAQYIPVSYTHLDVYKRQVLSAFTVAEAQRMIHVIKHEVLVKGCQCGDCGVDVHGV